MKHRTLIAAALAAGALAGGIAQAAPAVVAGTTPYGNNGVVPNYGPGPFSGTMTPGVTYQEPVYVQAPPPAPIYEAVPSSRAGYIWAPGHYVWDNGRYVWRGGEWMPARQGYGWQAAQWQQRPDGSWYLAGGHWVRSDSYANNDGRRGWGDRDRDGVVNRDDRYPDNPYRR